VNKLAHILLFFATIYILLKINKNVNTFTANIKTTTFVLVQKIVLHFLVNNFFTVKKQFESCCNQMSINKKSISILEMPLKII